MNRRLFALTAAAALLSLAVPPALAQTKWDLPAGYPATNFHTVNLNDFANDIDKATGGKLKITVHANGALFKAPEIKRAVQGGQAQAGEILLANFQNEWQLFGVDALPFLADSYDEAMKLYKVQKPFLEKKLAEQGMALLYAVPWPPQGIYVKKPINSGADLKGVK
jgi:TRAP-type C4-dicarboxylate transport system substrate-binding protein